MHMSVRKQTDAYGRLVNKITIVFEVEYQGSGAIYVQKISETYLRTEAFGHNGFEAKQEMKPYYNIVHKSFQVAILRKLRQCFFKMESPM